MYHLLRKRVVGGSNPSYGTIRPDDLPPRFGDGNAPLTPRRHSVPDLRGDGVLRSFVWLVLTFAAVAWLAAAKLPAVTVAADRPAVPSRGGDGWNRIVVPADERGHFVVEAEVNGTPVSFLVDSGASTVVLSPQDARRIGMPPERLHFTERFRTANGTVRAAPVELREIRIGQMSQRSVAASVNEAPMGISLLGVSFLGRLESWAVEDGRLALYW